MRNAYILKGADVKIWGLTPYERLVKTLRKIDDFAIIDDLKKLNANDRVLLIHGGYVYDSRVIKCLVDNDNIALYVEGENGKELVGIHTKGEKVESCLEALRENNFSYLPNELALINVAESYKDMFLLSLKKVEKPYVLNVSTTPINYIEDKLYYSSYKGVTDIVTRLVWPKPAKKAVRFCVDNKITPNQVTTLSLVLALLVGWLFYKNLYVLGLMLGWFMTFLDTVDGKLARVTVNYSKFGHRYDHIIDLLSPVYWYICWGLSLLKLHEPPTKIWLSIWIIVIFYVVGRLSEWGFHHLLKNSFNIFCWKPFDSFFRLVTARRNPNLIILTVATLFNGFAIGFYLVALWTLITSIILVVRFYQAYVEKKRKGPLHSWLDNITPEQYNKKIYKLFIYEN